MIRMYVKYPSRRARTWANREQLTPFVGESIEKTQRIDAQTFENYPKRFTGEDYLRRWKVSGGHDVVESEGSQVEVPRENMPVPFEEKPATKS